MNKSTLKNIPFKIILAYVFILTIIIFSGWKLYDENALFFKIDANKNYDESQLTTLSGLQHKISKVERFARNTIYSKNPNDLVDLNLKIDSLVNEINLTKEQLNNFDEIVLLDTVSNLLKQKLSNVASLQNLRSKQEAEQDVNYAILNLQQLEEHYRKLKIEDFVKDPNRLGNYERGVINKFVDYLNQNIPDDSTNTISQKKMDSILVSSKNLLNKVKISNEVKREAYETEEKKLLQNEKAISDRIQRIFITVEEVIIKKSNLTRKLKEESFKEVNNQISIYALIALGISVFFMVLNVLDYLKTQRYKRELEKANDTANYLLKSREQLISTVSHDLKSPIAAISGYGEILRKTNVNPKQAYYIDNIIKSSDYLANLANDLASLTLIEAGKIKLENSPFSLNQLLKDTAFNIQSINPNKPIELIFELDSKLDKSISTDPYRIKQIATNLIGNAYKFTTEGAITISSKLIDKSTASFYIKDTGIGIKEENLDHVFKEFTQADDSIEKRFGGTGLGLTISKKIAEILGGSINLTSVFGKGSTFTVYFKFNEYFESSKPGKLSEQESLPKGYKALLVDDDDQVLKLLKEILSKEGLIVKTYTNVDEASNAVKAFMPDIIFTDIQMPNKTGFDLVTFIKNNKNLNHIPVVALTGNTDAEKNKYQLAGFNALLSKPFSISSIHKTITSLLKDPTTFILNNKHLDGNITAYSLKSISEFLNNDTKQIQEFLNKSKQNNELYISDLKRLFEENNYIGIKILAHKMASIFKQLEHKEITQLLNQLENQVDETNLETQILELENKIKNFFNEIIE